MTGTTATPGRPPDGPHPADGRPGDPDRRHPADRSGGPHATDGRPVTGLGDGEVVALCRELVAARSVNPPGDTRAAAGVVRDFLAARGLGGEVVAARPEMPNVVAACDGAGPGRHLVLNVHLDTMDAGDESAWSVDPYTLTERDGRLYGLGMGNMKGAVAAMTAAFCRLAARPDWPGRVTLTAVSDEVVFGPHGAAHLLEVRPDLLGDGLLCGEGPGWMRLAHAEKGVLWLELRATADGGHASGATRGGTAVTRLARLIAAVDALHTDGDPGTTLTLNVGTVRGGTFVSQRAREAVAEVDVRLPPGTTMAAVEARVAELAAAVPGTGVRRLKGWEANATALDDPLAIAVAGAAAAVRGTPPEPVVRLPASDASRWRTRGVPAICYGPQPTLSAGVDDHAQRRDVLDCAEVYERAARAWLAGQR